MKVISYALGILIVAFTASCANIAKIPAEPCPSPAISTKVIVVEPLVAAPLPPPETPSVISSVSSSVASVKVTPIAVTSPKSGPPSAKIAAVAIAVPQSVPPSAVPTKIAAVTVAIPKPMSPPAALIATNPTVPVAIEQSPANAFLPLASTPLPPTLDVASLKMRLRETRAIGVFTKLSLKNQVDDLMQQFRTHYLSGETTSVAALRPPYDMLVLKVLALVQDSDPSLAQTISGSREAIWGILADPEKFASTH